MACFIASHSVCDFRMLTHVACEFVFRITDSVRDRW